MQHIWKARREHHSSFQVARLYSLHPSNVPGWLVWQLLQAIYPADAKWCSRQVGKGFGEGHRSSPNPLPTNYGCGTAVLDTPLSIGQ